MRRHPRPLSIVFLFVFTASAIAQPEQTDLFVAGEHGYVEFRIPSLVVTRSGTLLAYRKTA